MSLDALIQAAFQDGAGVSLSELDLSMQRARRIAELGELLVSQASSYIPDSFLCAAERWTELTPSDQRKLARRYFHWIVRKYGAHLTRQTLTRILEEVQKPYDERQLFPRYWG